MRQIDFFEVLENIDDKYIEEAETYKKARKYNYMTFLKMKLKEYLIYGYY